MHCSDLFLSYRGRCTEENFRLIRYSMRIWILQEKLGFSLMEARLFTRDERPETPEDIAEFFDIPLDTVKETIPVIEETVKAALEGDPHLFQGFEPVLPGDTDSCSMPGEVLDRYKECSDKYSVKNNRV